MKQWLKRVTGIEAEEKRLAEHEAALEAKEMENLKKHDPKAYATKRKEPWVNVLDMQVNKGNIRNGFFELDWNQYFIAELIENGYGEKADPEEEIVDRWFRDIVYNMLQEEEIESSIQTGYINVVPIDKGKSEVS
jgi:hypothetical protein